jgi:predicted naringenin-chalcone synthase
MRSAYFSDFRAVPARHSSPQEDSLRWLAAAHAEAQAAAAVPAGDARESRLVFEAQLSRYGGRPGQIARRGHELPDFLSQDWDGHRVFRLRQSPRGLGLAERTDFYAEAAERLVAAALPPETAAPAHLIHVTCTGYVSPSAAQTLAARRGWPTTVTHCYGMGCAGAFPAARMAAAFASSLPGFAGAAQRADVVHTELCSLHLDPSDHAPDQLVAQGLFADGCVKYSVFPERPAAPALELLGLREVLLPGCEDAMTWRPGPAAMRMTLSKAMPVLVLRRLKPFIEDLLAAAGAGLDALAGCAFAVHPGGPRIVDAAREALGLSEEQVAWSRAVLREHGNMSSATIPYVWRAILEDPAVPSGTLVPSVAFGPGLTVSGAVFRKLGP